MKKKVWILNHYASGMYNQAAGRHFWFAEKLREREYSPIIFTASTLHNSNEKIDVGQKKYIVKYQRDIPFVFIKTVSYYKNGLLRIANMYNFYKNILSISSDFSRENGKPDVILASSVHPLTLVAGLKLAKKFGVPCLCEVRDLWPESLVAYGVLKENSPFTNLLYKGEKRIYKNADEIIMTWEGGKQYIKDKGWEKEVDISKVHYINNGVMLKQFEDNIEAYSYEDPDLDDRKYKNFVYTGSIRKVNNLGLLLDAAVYIQEQKETDIRILVYGSGDEYKRLKQKCEDEKNNVLKFKGNVERKYIPSILSKSYANILHNSSTSLDKYGQSQNKLFEYMASGRCVIQTYKTGFGIIEKHKCGYTVLHQNAIDIGKVIIKASKEEQEVIEMGENASKAVQNYDFDILTEKLTKIIENS